MHYPLKGKTPKQVNQEMEATLGEDDQSNSMVKSGSKLLNGYALYLQQKNKKNYNFRLFVYSPIE